MTASIGFVGAALLALVGRLLFQVEDVDFTSLVAVLTWISLAGGPYLAGWVVSLVAENWTQWHVLPRWVKFILPMLASVGLSIGANLLLSNNDAVTALDPYYRMIAVSVLAYIGTQAAYMKSKQAGYASQAKVAGRAVYLEGETNQLKE